MKSLENAPSQTTTPSRCISGTDDGHVFQTESLTESDDPTKACWTLGRFCALNTMILGQYQPHNSFML